MSYQSLEFLGFTALALLLYYIVGQKRQKWVLLAANTLFFVISGWENIPVILLSMLCSFFTAKKMGAIYAASDEQLTQCQSGAERKQVKTKAKAKAKKILVWGMVVVLGFLIVYKTAMFLLPTVNAARRKPIELSLPLGISYYTFMAVSYMLDVFWRKIKAEKNFVSYGAFLSYFPHIIQGPIDRYSDMSAVLNSGAKLCYQNITYGAQLAVWGFFKKMVIADRLSVFVNTVMADHLNYAGSVLLLSAVFSAFEMYCNFSGCMDIVRGISQMFGIEIAKNFDHPFFSKNTAEFWRRWHMTLSAWFRDYVFLPISISPKVTRLIQNSRNKWGARMGKALSVIIPSAAVWLLTGLWHGTGINYVAWGVYWFVLTTASSVLEPEFKKLNGFLRINTEAPSWKIFQMIRTFLLFAAGRVISTTSSLQDTASYFGRIFTDFQIGRLFDRSIYTIGWDRSNCLLAFVVLGVLWAVSMLQKKGSLREQASGWNTVFRWILIYAMLIAIAVFGMYGPGFEAADFAYGNF